jgi:hypothetical protein
MRFDGKMNMFDRWKEARDQKERNRIYLLRLVKGFDAELVLWASKEELFHGDSAYWVSANKLPPEEIVQFTNVVLQNVKKRGLNEARTRR